MSDGKVMADGAVVPAGDALPVGDARSVGDALPVAGAAPGAGRVPDGAAGAGRVRRKVVLGVSAGIAAYKAVALLRLLTESGLDVRVVPTEGALRFVGEPTWAALSGHPVHTQVWSDVASVPHVRLGREADLLVVAPATADLLARAAHGIADDLLTNTLLTARCPVLLAPAMHTEMWLHPATRANVALLRERGVHVLEPDTGRLAGADSGPGRLPEPEAIFAQVRVLLTSAQAPVGHAVSVAQAASAGEAVPAVVAPLAGRRVVISAGGTREPLDPVRYLGNRSSGRQGLALAETALARGARVHLVAANVDLPVPPGAEVVRVESALELREAVLAEAKDADVVVMAAAVADFRPARTVEHKIKKTADLDGFTLELVRNPDVLAELAQRRPAHQVLVGFAAETGDADADVLTHARRKLAAKGCDLLVVNDVSGGAVFGRADTRIVVLDRYGTLTPVPEGSKVQAAEAVWDAVEAWSGQEPDPV